MNGKEIVRKIESTLFEKGITKKEFYEACGMNSATMSNWRNGVFSPSRSKLQVIEDYLGISFGEGVTRPTVNLDPETADLLDSIRERPELGILLRSARDVPASSVYTLVAQLEMEKERNAYD